MRFRSRYKPVPCLAGLVVSTLVCTHVGAKPAHATCGDYLLHQLPPMTGVDHEMGNVPHPDGQSPVPHSPGCRDGSCRSHHPLPLPEPTRVERGTDQWGCPASHEQTQPESRDWRVPCDARASAACQPLKLFRPPRAAG